MFDVGASYQRSDLLAFIGSKQQQSGILWGDSERGFIIVTSGGKHAARAGYADLRHPDGSWDYHGQGTTGDQDPSRFSNRLLIEGNRTVLLFTTGERTSKAIRESGTHAKNYVFEGHFGVSGWDEYIPVTGARKDNSLIRFRLVPCMDESDDKYQSTVSPEVISLTVEELRLRIDDLLIRPLPYLESTIKYRARTALVRRYVQLRARGKCELCERVSPFLTNLGQAYLETHHIFRLADDGPDHPRNMIALCPNCHREAHYGENARAVNSRCQQIATKIEDATR